MTVTFHPATSSLACDLCGCMIDSSERGREAHTKSHQQVTDVIDLTGRVAIELERLAS